MMIFIKRITTNSANSDQTPLSVVSDRDLHSLYTQLEINCYRSEQFGPVRHLSVILSSNNKWAKHIDLIAVTSSWQVSYLRKLKYQLPQNVLNKLYCTNIRPVLEYASEVWDGCNITASTRLEQV